MSRRSSRPRRRGLPTSSRQPPTRSVEEDRSMFFRKARPTEPGPSGRNGPVAVDLQAQARAVVRSAEQLRESVAGLAGNGGEPARRIEEAIALLSEVAASLKQTGGRIESVAVSG